MWALIMGIYLMAGMVWDLIHMKVPVIYLTAGTCFALSHEIICHERIRIITAGGIIIGMLFLLISKYTKEQIGYGDSWMILNLGIYLGLWDILSMLGIVFGTCFIFSCLGLALKKINRYTRIPFYPFLMLGYAGAIVW